MKIWKRAQVKLTIEVGAEEFEAAVNKAYLKMRGKINVPGFRPGKAPRKIIEGMYGAEVFYEEAVNIVLPDAYEAAVKEQKLEVVGYPQVELESCGKEGVVFQVHRGAVHPEVKLGQYKGLDGPQGRGRRSWPRTSTPELKEMADRDSRLVSVERAAKKGDTAVIDFEGFDNGVAFDGGKGENLDLELGSGSFVPGFEDQLVGMKAGEEKDIDITFPENYHPRAGRQARRLPREGQRGQGQGACPPWTTSLPRTSPSSIPSKELKADLKKKITGERKKSAQRAFEDAADAEGRRRHRGSISPTPWSSLQAEKMVNNLQAAAGAPGYPL